MQIYLQRWHDDGGMQPQVALPPRRDPERLRHVQLLRPPGELPVEMEEEARQRDLHDGEPERDPGAHPPPRPERHKLEVRPSEVHRRRGFLLEPLRPELLGVRPPARRVPADGPRVDQHHGALGHVVPEDATGLAALPREEQRHCRVQPERLLDHQPQVRQLLQGLLPGAALPGERAAHLRLRPPERRRFPHQLRHGPLQRRRRGLAPGPEEVPHHSTDRPDVERRAAAAAVQKHVQDVLLFLAAGAGRLPRAFLLDDAVHEPGHLPDRRLHLARRPAERAREARRRKQVGETEPSGHPDTLAKARQEGFAVRDPVANHGAHYGVGDIRGDEGADVHSGSGRRLHGHGRNEGGRLGLTRPSERPNPRRAEKLRGAELADTAPVVAVRREGDAEAVSSERNSGVRPRPRGEGDVVGLHDLHRRGRRRGHNDGELAHAEQHERAVPEGEVAHGAVRERAHEVVHAADHRQLPWPRRQVQRHATILLAASPELDDEEKSEKQDGTGQKQAMVLVVPRHGYGLEPIGNRS
ncbi:hypothetical protein CFC21_111871 [Triticum aestivum]|uniref:Uncharacterized protein n=2 Tax=Triticum aestivum TaxID=4565 RepID=A0A9R1MQY1_WHEAT|nr:hypothetical protein CFC21_111871 [Triticum aestivum]